MKVDLWMCTLLGLTNATALKPRAAQEDGVDDASPDSYDWSGYKGDEYKPKDPPPYKPEPPAYKPKDPPPYKPEPPVYKPKDPPGYKPEPPPYKPDDGYKPEKKPYDKPWKPITQHPEFFSLKVDDKCTTSELPNRDRLCPFDGFAIRLESGIAIATPYSKWYDPKLPIFFVDDDTQTYTVSKKPLQLYIDSVTGALRYAPVGWLPPNSISRNFFKLGTNPLGKVDPSPSYFSWPITEGRAFFGVWWLCPLSGTGQYQVFISDINFGASRQGGVWKDTRECKRVSLAAINANPWKKGGY